MFQSIPNILFSSILIALIFSTKGCNEVQYKSDDLITKRLSKIDNELGPPFSDSCQCRFNLIKEVRTSEERFDIVYSGKGWNPNYYSCTWVWEELVNNDFPPDSLVSDFRCHLIFADKISDSINLDSSFFKSDWFKSKLIVTFSKEEDEEFTSSKYDPFENGLFSKPSHINQN